VTFLGRRRSLLAKGTAAVSFSPVLVCKCPNQRAQVAALTFLLYDIALTFDQEVLRRRNLIVGDESTDLSFRLTLYGRKSPLMIAVLLKLHFFASIPWGITKLLFFFIRYFPVLYQTYAHSLPAVFNILTL
jgi:hypothetical protein